MSLITPVILVGGSGKRLWPLSRESMPKQFVPLLGKQSTFQQTLLRVADHSLFGKPVIATNDAYRFMCESQAREIGIEIDILVEPSRRDSGPAMAAAAAYTRGLGAKAVLALASDHLVIGAEEFLAGCREGLTAVEKGGIVTFGIPPTEPKTDYGYIRPGTEKIGPVMKVAAFVEKPNAQTAMQYIAEGLLWNSGNFAFKASTLLGEFEAFEPTVAAAAKACVAALELEAGIGRIDRETFAQAKKISLDYAVMEHTKKAAVVPAAFAWSDLGAWDAIWEASARDDEGNAQDGDVDLHQVSNVLVRTTGPYVGVIGISDIVVVAEPDAILVCHRKDSQAVKTLVDGLRAKGRSIASRKSAQPGSAETLVSTNGFDVALRRAPAGETITLPASTVQLLEGVLEVDGDVYAAGAIIPLEAQVRARAIGAATLLVTTARSLEASDAARMGEAAFT